MYKALPLRFKWWLCVATVSVLYAAVIYLLGHWPSSSSWPQWLLQFAITAISSFAWLCVLEWLLLCWHVYDWLHRWRQKGLWYDVAAAFLLMFLSLSGAYTAMPLALPFLKQAGAQLDPGNYLHFKRAYYGLIATQTLCGFFIFLSRQLIENAQQVEVKTAQLEKENLVSQFSALKSQVNPHFLFNSLSILSSLVKRDPELSERFIEQLSTAYRYILEQKDSPLVALQTELEFLQSYTFLLRTRFEHKFEVEITVEANTRQQAQIAPLTLQLLVENAVKHNRMSEKEPLVVYIRQREKTLEIRNVLRPRGELVNSTGLGLQNIINRYKLLCDEPVWAGEQEGDFVVQIPLFYPTI